MSKDIEALTGADATDFRDVVRKHLGKMSPVIVPAVADFTWVNQGTATAVDEEGGIYIERGLSAGNSMSCLVKALPGTTFTAEMLWDINAPITGNSQFGMMLRESSTGKIALIEVIANTSIWEILTATWSNPTTWTADNYWHTGRLLYGVPKGFKIVGNGSTTRAYLTYDGVHWLPAGATTPALNSGFTTAPNQAGFFVHPNATARFTGDVGGFKVKHFKVS